MAEDLSASQINDLVTDVIAEAHASYGETNPSFRGFRDLRVWQVGMDVVTSTYAITESFPSKEQFGLTTQVRRACISIALNIAEGWGRNGRPEFARFCDIAFGSLTETEACFDVAVRLGYVHEAEITELRLLIDRLSRMLHKLRAKLRS